MLKVFKNAEIFFISKRNNEHYIGYNRKKRLALRNTVTV